MPLLDMRPLWGVQGQLSNGWVIFIYLFTHYFLAALTLSRVSLDGARQAPLSLDTFQLASVPRGDAFLDPSQVWPVPVVTGPRLPVPDTTLPRMKFRVKPDSCSGDAPLLRPILSNACACVPGFRGHKGEDQSTNGGVRDGQRHALETWRRSPAHGAAARWMQQVGRRRVGLGLLFPG